MIALNKFLVMFILACLLLAACSEQPEGHPKTGDLACKTCHSSLAPPKADALAQAGYGQKPITNPDPSQTRWALVSYGSMGKEAFAGEGHAITLVFLSGGMAAGSAGCNAYAAPYTVEGGHFTFGEITHTKKTCAQAVAQQEADFFQALQSAGSFEQGETWLTLHYQGGQGQLNWVKLAPKP